MRARAAIGLAVMLVAAGVVAAADESSGRAYLGVGISEETEHPEGGARVDRVVPGSPADAAGLRAGDIVVGFAGEPIHGPMRLTERIHARSPGERVPIEIVRDDERKTLEVELGEQGIRRRLLGRSPADEERIAELERRARELAERNGEMERLRSEELAERYREFAEQQSERWQERSEDWAERYREMAERLRDRSRVFVWQPRPVLGVQLAETTPELRQHLGGREDAGVLVNRVLPGTPAQAAGIRVGDLILSVDGQPVASAEDLIGELADKHGTTIAVELVRDRRTTTLEVAIPEPGDPDETGPQA